MRFVAASGADATSFSETWLSTIRSHPKRTVCHAGRSVHGYFALDTETGTLCQTLTSDKSFSGASEWANDVPTCKVVLAAHPD